MVAVGKAVHKTDGHGLDPVRLEQVNGFLHVIQVKGFDLLAVTVQPPANALTQIAGDQRHHICATVVILFLTNAPAHFQRIADPFGGDQAGLGPVTGQGGIGGYCRAVNDGIHGGGKLRQAHGRVHAFGNVRQAVHDRDRRVGRRGQGLVNAGFLAGLVDEKVGECPAHINANF